MIRYPHTKNKEILTMNIIYPRTTLPLPPGIPNICVGYKDSIFRGPGGYQTQSIELCLQHRELQTNLKCG